MTMFGEETSMTGKTPWRVGCALAMLVGTILPAAAQAPWPSKTITYVVPFAPGGNTDTLARLIAPKLSAALGQPIVIDNKPGAGGNIGSDFVAKAKPDGHTILGGTISSHAINASVYPKLPYDVVKSFEPVILLGTSPLVLVAGAATPYQSLQQVIAAAKAKPGELTFASAGSGTSPHLAGELLKMTAQIKMEHIPYKGSGPAVTDVVAGHVPLMFDTTLVVGSHVKAGKLRPLAVTSSKRISSMPDVPTAAESGVPGFEVATWQAVFAPAGTPKPIVDRLNTEIAKILKQPEIEARLADLAVDAGGGSSESLREMQRAEVVKWEKVVKEAGVKPD
jgi:tripartite-type tricarboxylate transporter receptor subunit TctC